MSTVDAAAKKLQNPTAEIRAIVTALSAPLPELRTAVLARLDSTHFAYTSMREAHERLMQVLKAASSIPSKEVFLGDTALSTETVEALSGDDILPVATQDDLDHLVHQLNEAKQFRTAHMISLGITTALKREKSTVPDVTALVEQGLLELRSKGAADIAIYHSGTVNNSDDVVRGLLDPTDNSSIIPSCFANFDSKTGGHRRGDLVVIASHYKGGKSIMKLNMLHNMYKFHNLSTLDLTMEMGVDEETARLLSLMSGVDFSRIYRHKQEEMTYDEVKRINAAWAKHKAHGEENNCRFSIYPAANMTIQQLELMIKPFKYDVVAIDYVNLLRPEGGAKDHGEVQMLSAHYKALKLMAKNLNCLVIALTQLDKATGDIRYAKVAKEDANNVWSWMYGESEQAHHVLKIKQLAARSHQPFTFYLRENFETMEITDYDGDIPEDEDLGDGKKDDAFDGKKPWKKN